MEKVRYKINFYKVYKDIRNSIKCLRTQICISTSTYFRYLLLKSNHKIQVAFLFLFSIEVSKIN